MTDHQTPNDASQRGLSNEIGTSGQYEIMQNQEGHILLLCEARQGEPDSPRLVYDGKDVAVLYRNFESTVAFRDIVEPARKPLYEAKTITVIEVISEEESRDYEVEVHKVKDVGALIVK